MCFHVEVFTYPMINSDPTIIQVRRPSLYSIEVTTVVWQYGHSIFPGESVGFGCATTAFTTVADPVTVLVNGVGDLFSFLFFLITITSVYLCMCSIFCVSQKLACDGQSGSSIILYGNALGCVRRTEG